MTDLTPVSGDDARRAINAFTESAGHPGASAEVKDETMRRYPIGIDRLGDVTDVAISFVQGSLSDAEYPDQFSRDFSMFMVGFVNGVIAMRVANGELDTDPGPE